MRLERIGAKADLSEEHPRADLRGPGGERVLVTPSRRWATFCYTIAFDVPESINGMIPDTDVLQKFLPESVLDLVVSDDNQ